MKTLKIIFRCIAFILFTSLILVSCEPEDTPPELTYLKPYDGENNVSVHTEIIVRYNEPVVVNDLSFSLKEAWSSITIEAEISTEGYEVILTPIDSLRYDTEYSVHFAGEISDLAGNVIRENRSWNFATISDLTHPYFVSISPRDGADSVSVDTKVIVEFSEPVIVNTSNFFFTEAESSVSVEAEVSVDRNKAILTPVNLLPHGVEYIVHLTNKISDLAGNTLERSYEWNFITVECEPHSLDWSRTFGCPYLDEAHSVQQTTDGGYILAGYTDPHGSGNYNALLIKTDVRGIEQWSQTFGGINVDWIYSVQQTTDGGYILAGYTDSYGAGYGDAWLIKTDAAGVEQWSQTLGGSEDDNEVWSIQQTTDGGYILAGRTYSYNEDETKEKPSQLSIWNKYDAQLIKTNAAGVEQWSQTFGGSGNDYAESIQQTMDGGYILAGYTDSYGAGYGDAWLIKISH